MIYKIELILAAEHPLLNSTLGREGTSSPLKGFGLTPLSGDRRGYMPPLLKTKHTFSPSSLKQEQCHAKRSQILRILDNLFSTQCSRSQEPGKKSNSHLEKGFSWQS